MNAKQAIEQMCKNCTNHEMCMGTGCAPKKTLMSLLDQDYQNMMICAVRYGLGRRTYIVGIICDYIKTNIKSLTTKTINILVRDIVEASNDEMLGDNCDVKEWMKLLEILKEELDGKQIG